MGGWLNLPVEVIREATNMPASHSDMPAARDAPERLKERPKKLAGRMTAGMTAEELKAQIEALGDTDYVVRGTAGGGEIRAFAATTRRTVQVARDAHQTSPVVTAALGRLLTAGAMMGSMLKDPGELLSLVIRGDGPIASLTVTADSEGHVKGFAGNPDVWLPLNAQGKLDVAAAVGKGDLTVIQDTIWGEPYCSQLELLTGEIGDDIGAYYVQSEQIPTSVGVGVLVETDLSVRQAGGFIVQAMPDCSEEALDRLGENLAGMSSVTRLLDEGLAPADILERVLDGLGFEPLEVSPCSFACNCSRERTTRVLISLGRDELQKLIDEGEPVELSCNFCSSKYTFSLDEVRELVDEMAPAGEGETGEEADDDSAAGDTPGETGAGV